MSETLKGKRIAVVGASAGIGRHFAIGAARAGAEVLFGARRAEALEGAVAEAGAGHVVSVDVCDEASRAGFADTVRRDLGALDLLLCTVGFAVLRPLAGTDEEVWARTVATNLVGLNRLIDVTLPLLSDSGVIAVMSSEAAAAPRHGLVPYAASKAALEASLRGWRVEHPGIRVSCVIVGGTFPTEFGANFDIDHLGSAMEAWQRQGVLQTEYMAPEDVAGCLLHVYGAALTYPGVCIEEIRLRSPSPLAGTPGT